MLKIFCVCVETSKIHVKMHIMECVCVLYFSSTLSLLSSGRENNQGSGDRRGSVIK